MTKKKPASPLVARVEQFFAVIEDPRIARTRKHELLPLLMMSLAGVISGAEGWEDLAFFAKAREQWWAQMFELPHGTPSPDTFRRVISALDPDQFEACLRTLVSDVAQSFKGEVIALDGKAVRGAYERASRTTPLHMMQVWATSQRLVLGQMAVPGAPGEIDAIPKLLALFDLRGAIVTSDANGTTAGTTQAVRKAGADFVLALKGNRKSQYVDVRERFDSLTKEEMKSVSNSVTTDRGHGRIEIRTAHALPVNDWKFPEWRDVKSVVRIIRERNVVSEKEPTFEDAYYLTSLDADAAKLADIVRTHWSIENHLNWCLDITFREDARLVRDHNGAQNLARLSRLAMMMLRNEPLHKGRSMKQKRKLAGWMPDYLLHLLVTGIAPAQ